MKSSPIILIALLALQSTTVYAEVTASGDNGFSIHHTVPLDASPENTYRAIVNDVGKWWVADHTYTGDPANLSLEAQAGGCFCEKLADGGSMQHMLVTWAQPGKELRMTGGLGPLQMMGIHGGMQWLLEPAENGTVLEYNYTVTGFSPDGLANLAPIVDAVQGQQLEALKAYLLKSVDTKD